nr:MAG TPA: hypothetical protein [Ackermannviridae sp.]
MNFLASFLGGKLFNSIIDIIKPFLPTDEKTQGEILEKLGNLQIEELKERGNYIDKLGRIKDLVIPAFLFILLLMFSVNYFVELGYSMAHKIPPVMVIDNTLVSICDTIIMFLFGSKTISRFSESYVNYKYGNQIREIK